MHTRSFVISFVAVLTFAPATAHAAEVAGDFNGDNLKDIAIGVPEENLAGAGNGGAVNVIYGTPAGLAPAGNQFWSQESPGIEDVPESGDRFGHSVAAGDFNADGFDDMAVGAQREDIGAIPNAGAVHVIYGSPAGLTNAGNQFWSQDSVDVEDAAEADDWFGTSVAAGQSGTGPGDELAIGVPNENLDDEDAGAVNVLYGSPAGISAAGDQFWHEDVPNIEDSTGATERFGSIVTWGNFNGDANDDLAITTPREVVGSVRGGAGAVIYGSNTGLTSTGDQQWSQDSPGIEGTVEGRDMIRSSLAVGDFNADGRDDLVLGIDGENVGPLSHTGAANVIYGTSGGLNSAGDQYWHQDVTGIEDVVEAGDNFAWSVTAGDFNGDGPDDLAIGARGERVGSIADAGVVNVIPGSPSGGLTEAGDVVISQDSPGVEEDVEARDEFGSALFAGDTNGDGRDELGVGAILEDVLMANGVDTAPNAGTATVLYDAFVAGGPSQLWHQDIPGILDRLEADDRLGYAFGPH